MFYINGRGIGAFGQAVFKQMGELSASRGIFIANHKNKEDQHSNYDAYDKNVSHIKLKQVSSCYLGIYYFTKIYFIYNSFA